MLLNTELRICVSFFSFLIVVYLYLSMGKKRFQQCVKATFCLLPLVSTAAARCCWKVCITLYFGQYITR